MPAGIKQRLIQDGTLLCQSPLRICDPCFPFQDLPSHSYLVSSPSLPGWFPALAWAWLNDGFPFLGRLSPHAAFSQRHLESPAEPLS